MTKPGAAASSPMFTPGATTMLADPSGALFEQLLHFDGPPELFATILASYPQLAGDASGGAVFAITRKTKAHKIIALQPPDENGAPPEWLKQTVEAALSGDPIQQVRLAPRPNGSAPAGAPAATPSADPVSGIRMMSSGPGGGTTRTIPTGAGMGTRPAATASPINRVAIAPLRIEEQLEEYACFMLVDTSPQALAHTLRRLTFVGVAWRHFHSNRDLAQSETDAALAPAMRTLAAVNQPTKFLHAAMALVNELASQFQCDRVSLGFLRGRYVKLAALSHSEKFSRKVELAQAIESAMEECLDQDGEIVFPPPPESATITRAANDLCRRFGSNRVLAVPLRYENVPVAVMLLERSGGPPPDPLDVRLLRLTADLVSPRLIELERRDRWFGARFAAWLRKGAAWAVGPKNTWAKVGALAALGAVLFLIFAVGTYRVDGTFVIQPLEKRVLAAAFDGFIEEVHARPGDDVEAGVPLARLETAELRARLAAKQAEKEGYDREAALALRDEKTGEAHIAQARAEQAAADAALLQEHIGRAAINAPETGVVLAGDWIHRVGAPVKRGDTLFELAPLRAMEADVLIPEEMIADVREDMEGELATAGRPNEKIRFRILRITPVAELVKQNNVFRARVLLLAPPDWLRPGMEGVAKVEAGERHYAWIWTRRAVNWVRMKLWL